ncbi:hypothetical protein EW146_g7585 [Bondarzewia mesenterica]|uniref:Small ribosomal subunit protein mS41 n=1 Tax=Bondarzewia mesenterica TaxID=1095465 RepID=A0A4S4LKD5_9AGAM|nr:hypothetical protein EW146_g7585 [Bondarzewia mesenterica]
MSFSLGASLRSFAPCFSRTLQNKALSRPVPPPRGSITSPEAFLKAIGRSSETKVSYETWEQLWHTSGIELKKNGLSVQDRRYVLWAMQKFRLGEDPLDFTHDPKKKKKIRGWGPAVQNGKRIRSRRHQ